MGNEAELLTDGGAHLLSNERETEIVRMVQERGSCSVGALAERLEVTTETVRRNLKALVRKGLLVKYHGGVMVPQSVTTEPPLERRMRVKSEEKIAIAAKVAAMVQDGDSLMLDTGSTTIYVARALAARSGLTVLTNSLEIARILARGSGNKVFLPGGEVRADDAAVFGTAALAFVNNFRARRAILSIGAIVSDGTLANFHLCEAEFTRALIQNAEQTWVVADHTKFDRSATYAVCNLIDVDVLITNRALSPTFAALCRSAEVEVF